MFAAQQKPLMNFRDEKNNTFLKMILKVTCFLLGFFLALITSYFVSNVYSLNYILLTDAKSTSAGTRERDFSSLLSPVKADFESTV